MADNIPIPLLSCACVSKSLKVSFDNSNRDLQLERLALLATCAASRRKLNRPKITAPLIPIASLPFLSLFRPLLTEFVLDWIPTAKVSHISLILLFSVLSKICRIKIAVSAMDLASEL